MNDQFYKRLQKLKKYHIAMTGMVVLAILFSLFWNLVNEKNQIQALALFHARASFSKDLMFRNWVASHGGVYVPPTKRTPSNPYLKNVEDKDVVTTDGKKLTLMNPAYVLRQVMNENEGLYDAKGHITSLKLLNPANTPSKWEEKALKLFESTDKIEMYEFIYKGGNEYMYYIQALKVKQSCLKCHAQQGYKIGDIRGGISVSIPMRNYNSDLRDVSIKIIAIHLVFIFITIFILYYAYKWLKESLIKQDWLYAQNKHKDDMLLAQSRNAAMGEMISMIAHQWRQPIAIIAMWANNITADIDMEEVNEEDFRLYAANINEQTQHLSQTIDDFRNFFRPDKEKEKIAIKNVMENCLAVIEKSLSHNNIALTKQYNSESLVEIYSRELMQVFLNILKNSKDALEAQDIEKAIINIDISEDEGNIIVKISDNAKGIKEDIIEKIFDPYFTTKSVKSGTGIGLYMSKTIVEQHLGGSIGVENIEDGVCFTIKLPK